LLPTNNLIWRDNRLMCLLSSIRESDSDSREMIVIDKKHRVHVAPAPGGVLSNVLLSSLFCSWNSCFNQVLYVKN
jgi:hypothetical protein